MSLISKNITLLVIASSYLSFGISELSEGEKGAVIENLKSIYSSSHDPERFNRRPPKYFVSDSRPAEPNEVLRTKEAVDKKSTLQQLAQTRLDPQFQQAQCQWLNQHTLNKGCKSQWELPSWEFMDHNNQIEQLTSGWLTTVEKNIDKLPFKGESAIDLWSDDYWRLEWGGISYRYSSRDYFDGYKEAITSYLQPDQWLKLLLDPSLPQRNNQIDAWAPSEKYDLSVNDLGFTLTREQKEEGALFADEEGNVESWMGLCHGWAAAAIMAPKPVKSVQAWGPEGSKIRFFPHDIRALTSLAWANGDYSSSFVGTRCNRKTPELSENGRVKDSECFDNNPASFHLALGNMIGLEKASFVMDAAFDYQVWNQPIKGYEFTFFNPLAPEQQSKNGLDVAVSYDAKFKSIDPFQKPLTRGKRNNSSSHYDDTGISKVVGVIVSVVYLAEVVPVHGESARGESLIRVTYTYDLELSQTESGFEIVGGEWHSNAHPDFLWVPTKGSMAHHLVDLYSLNFTGGDIPSASLTKQGQLASRLGYPLCSVISHLVQQSSGREYHCPSYRDF